MTREFAPLPSLLWFALRVIFIGNFLCDFAFSQEVAPKAVAGKNFDKKNPFAAVKAMDLNKNGYLEANEIPPQHRAKMMSWAKSKGMNTNKPLQLTTLLDKDPKATRSKEDKQAITAKKAAREKTKAKDANTKDGKKQNNNASDAKAKKNSKAFGSNAKQTTDKGNKNQVAKDESDSKERVPKRLQIAARSLMYQNDKNKNKRLEKSEWSRLKGDPSKADTNRDGSLSMDELTNHLAGYGSREEKPRPKYRTAVKRSKGNTGKKSYRFLTPHERLPEGLPDWFIERDDNFDGQLSLREYAPSLTAAKYKKFRQLDLNGDGLLLAKEYLSATK